MIPGQASWEALAANACCHARAFRVLRQADNPDESAWLPGARLNAADAALAGRDPDAPARASLTRGGAINGSGSNVDALTPHKSRAELLLADCSHCMRRHSAEPK